jgi:hypothetical protein
VLLFCAKKVAGRKQQNADAPINGCALLFCYFWMAGWWLQLGKVEVLDFDQPRALM